MTKLETHNNQTVLAVINLANTDEQQQNLATYAVHFANKMGLTLVLYPMTNTSSIFFKKNPQEKFNRAVDIAIKMHNIAPVRVAEKLTSITDIAKQEHASYIIMEVDENATLFGDNIMWKTIRNSHVPIYLVPKDFVFQDIKTVTIAVDAERKIQKTRAIAPIVKAFGSTVNIFTDREKTKEEELFIEICQNQITEYFDRNDIPYNTPTKVRKLTKFVTRICKFSAKHTDLLVLEVDPGSLDKVVKRNIKELLTLWKNSSKKITPTPVMLTKTKETGRYGTFR
jgi:hypothetical protein